MTPQFEQKNNCVASILAVGTELTAGQIVNKNSQWLSANLKKFGVETQIHLTIPDDRSLILKSLQQLELTSDLIFVTGGLGPTSDDFTRELVNKWAKPGQTLEFHQASWEHIEKILTPRGIPLRDSQKQQCLFPPNAKVLVNGAGTANGFQLKVRNCDVFVLPGPPREIQAIWNDHINPWLTQNTRHLDPLITHSWDTMGLGESEIAHLTENALQGATLETGYRVHLPYVEVKLSFKKSQAQQVQAILASVEKALAPYTILKNGEVSADLFFAALEKKFDSAKEPFVIIDELTRGYLWTRLKDKIAEYSARHPLVFANTNLALAANSVLKNALILPPLNETENLVTITLLLDGKSHEIVLHSPYTKHALFERKLQYFAEMTLIESSRLIL